MKRINTSDSLKLTYVTFLERPVTQAQASTTQSTVHEVASLASLNTIKINLSDTLTQQVSNPIRRRSASITYFFSSLKTEGSVQSMSYIKTLNEVWVGDGNGNLYAYTANGQFLRSSKVHQKRIYQILFVKPNIWTCSLDQTVK